MDRNLGEIMSDALNQYHASAGDDHKHVTLEISCSEFETRYFVNGFNDIEAGLEDGETTVTFEACGIAVSLPANEEGAEMELQFGIENVTGEARQLIEKARKAGAQVFVILRFYMDSDLTLPCITPIKFKTRTAATTRNNCSINAGIGFLSNSAWPRDRFTLEYCPGLANT